MKRIIIFLLCLMPMFLKAQQLNVDSLVNVLNTKKLNITETLDLYDKISKFYVMVDMKKGIEYSKKGLILAQKEKDKSMAATFNKYLGIIYHNKSRFDTSAVYFNNSLSSAIDAKDRKAEAAAYGSLGNLYRIQQNYELAVEYYMKVLSVCDDIEDGDIVRASTLANLGVVHRSMNNYERAVSFFEQAIEIAEKYNNEAIIMSSSHGLGTVYGDKQEYDKAKGCMLKALELSKKLSNRDFQAISTMALASIFSVNKDYDNALIYANEGLDLAEKFGNPSRVLSSLISLSKIHRDQGRYKEAEEVAMRAWEMDSTSLGEGLHIALNIAIANIHLGNKKKAEEFIWAYQEIVAKGNDKSLHNSLADMEVKYETEKKEIRIAALEKDKKLYLGLGIAVAFALLSAIGLLFYRHRSATQKRMLVEQKIKQLEQEKELAVAQSALKAEKAERDLIARDLHDSVGTLLTVVKNNMKLYSNSGFKETDYFEKAFNVLGKSITDLRRVVYHVKTFILNKEGFVTALDEFCRSIPTVEFQFRGLNRRFDSDKEYILFNCVCELINNALKHSEASQIDVHLNIDEGTVYLSVVDNGCGFDPQAVTWGIGIENIRSNLSVFDGRLDIYSEPDKGTEINIEMDA